MRKVFLVLLLISCSAFCRGISEEKEQRMGVAMRLIGHDFLLSIGDSNSRVLPVNKVGERYQISFEKEFTFQPDSLLAVLKKSLDKSKVTENYILEIQKCDSTEVVHAALIGGPYDGIIPCGQRNQPVDCYQFYFTNLDSEPEELTTVQENDSKTSYGKGFLILSTMALALFSFLLWRKKPKETNSNSETGVEIGNYILEPNSMKLILKGTTEQLSGKEYELLILLNTHRNQNVERETILTEVWGDQGAYVGRTLDVFISKLRKKLQADSNIEIKNIRGVGYRLIVT